MGVLLVLVLAAQTKEVAEAGSKAADTLTQTVLGSLVILLLIVCALIGYLLVKAKNEHIKDKDTQRAELLEQALKSRELAAASTKSTEALVRESEAMAAELAKNTEHLQRVEMAVNDKIGKVDALQTTMNRIDAAMTDVGAASRGSCRGAEEAAANVDALAMAIPGVDRDKYYLATKRSKGGGP